MSAARNVIAARAARVGTGVFLALIVSAGRVAAQVPPTPSGKSPSGPSPRLVIPERNCELGTVISGDAPFAKWILENKGDADLIIKETVSSCGCTVVQLAEEAKIIRPGGSLELKAQFQSAGRRGEQIKTVAVHTNDPIEPKVDLQFHAKVEVLFEMNPAQRVNLQAVQRGQTAKRTLDITPAAEKKSLELTEFKIKNPGLLQTAVEPLPSASGPGHRIRFTVADTAPMGQMITEAELKLKIDGLEKSANVPIYFEVVADLTASPKVVQPPQNEISPGQKLAPVSIRSLEKTPFEILEAKAGPPLNVAFQPAEGRPTGTEFTITLTVQPDAPPGPFATLLEVRTSSLSQPIVKIPVFGVVAALVDVDPPVIVLRKDGTDPGTQRRVRVEARGKTKLEISSIRCDHPAVAAEVDRQAKVEQDNVGFVNVRLSPDFKDKTGRAVLTLGTGVPGAETVQIPVVIETPG
jgi:hypothetical protein